MPYGPGEMTRTNETNIDELNYSVYIPEEGQAWDPTEPHDMFAAVFLFTPIETIVVSLVETLLTEISSLYHRTMV